MINIINIYSVFEEARICLRHGRPIFSEPALRALVEKWGCMRKRPDDPFNIMGYDGSSIYNIFPDVLSIKSFLEDPTIKRLIENHTRWRPLDEMTTEIDGETFISYMLFFEYMYMHGFSRECAQEMYYKAKFALDRHDNTVRAVPSNNAYISGDTA